MKSRARNLSLPGRQRRRIGSIHEAYGGSIPARRLARRTGTRAELHQLGTVIAGFRLHGQNLTANDSAYYAEAGAVRIRGGKVLGALYSFGAFLFNRMKHRPRLDLMLLGDLKRSQ